MVHLGVVVETSAAVFLVDLSTFRDVRSLVGTPVPFCSKKKFLQWVLGADSASSLQDVGVLQVEEKSRRSQKNCFFFCSYGRLSYERSGREEGP